MQTVPPYSNNLRLNAGNPQGRPYYPSQAIYTEGPYSVQRSSGPQGYRYGQPIRNQRDNQMHPERYLQPSHLQPNASYNGQYINPEYQYNFDPRHQGYYDLHYQGNTQYSNSNAQYLYPHGQNVYQQQNIQGYGRQFGVNHQSAVRRNPAVNADRRRTQYIKQIVYEQQPLNIPQPVRSIQYIPHLNKYMDYVEERVKVPVEKYFTDYYEIQHITDFVPRQYQDTVIQMVPQEIVRYRLEYVPVQRKIVHLPKKQIYDQKGLFKRVGNLSDRVLLEQPTLGITSQNLKREQNQISRTLYQNLSSSQMSKRNTRGLQQSLVNAIAKQVQTTQNPQRNINRGLYEGSRTNLNPNMSGRQQNINQTLYKNMSRILVGASEQPINQTFSRQTGANPQRQVNQTLYKMLSASQANMNSPQNQMMNQQIYNSISKNTPMQNARTKTSRRRTNFVTSDNYSPNYQGESGNQNYGNRPNQNNQASMQRIGDNLAHMLGSITASKKIYDEYKD